MWHRIRWRSLSSTLFCCSNEWDSIEIKIDKRKLTPVRWSNDQTVNNEGLFFQRTQRIDCFRSALATRTLPLDIFLVDESVNLLDSTFVDPCRESEIDRFLVSFFFADFRTSTWTNETIDQWNLSYRFLIFYGSLFNLNNTSVIFEERSELVMSLDLKI